MEYDLIRTAVLVLAIAYAIKKLWEPPPFESEAARYTWERDTWIAKDKRKRERRARWGRRLNWIRAKFGFRVLA